MIDSRSLAIAVMCALASVMASAQTPTPVFDATFDGAVVARDAAGNSIVPVRSESPAFAEGRAGQVLRADGGYVVFDGAVLPADRGTIEVWVSPLASGAGKGWHFFTGDPEEWAPQSVPRVWMWNGGPRFDIADGDCATYGGMPSWLDWTPGTWHHFVATWDRAGQIALYIDGRFFVSKKLAPWEPVAVKRFAIGTSGHIEGGRLDPANALIESVRVYDRVLSDYAILVNAKQGGAYVEPPAVAPHPDWRNTLAPQGDPGPRLDLAVGGAPQYTILLPESPTPVEEKAAADLARWLMQMAGNPFAIASEGGSVPTGPVVSVGRTRRLDEANVEAASADLGLEGYGIAVYGKDLFLWGGDTRGVVNAVYALLEEDLGCRWFQRGTATIPHSQDLSVAPVPRTFVPVLEVRDPYYWDAFVGEWSLHNRTSSPNARVPDNWGGHMRYAGGFFVHTYWRLVPANKYFDEHPEYFSEVGGKRVTSQLCVTNPDVIRLAIERTLEALRADPTAQLISISPNDGRGYCECERCSALDTAEGSKSASLLQLVNAVADAIKDEFPNTKVSTLAYLDTVQPPKTIRPRDNVVIRLCTDRHAWSHDFEFQTETQEFQTALKAWADIGAKIHIWDYTANYSHYMIPMPNMPIVTQNVRFMIDHNVKGIMLQGAYQSPGAARGPLRCWVWGKQLWNPELNTRDLIRDFTYGFYGAAAVPMQAYNELLWRTWELEHMRALREAGNIRYPPTARFLSDAFLAEATDLFAQAEALAGDAETLHRVELAKLSILYTKVARGPQDSPEEYSALLDEFERLARRERVTHLWEGDTHTTQLDERIPYWRGLARAKSADASAVPVGELWQFQPDPDEKGDAEKWYAPDLADLEWTRVNCTEGWGTQGFKNYVGTGWYRVRFNAPASFKEAPCLRLFFPAVDEDAVVYINGKKAFEHTCESTGLTPEQIWNQPFAFDPTEFLNFGGENVIAVRVYNRANMGGIYKPVYLVSTNKEIDPAYLEDLIRKQ